MSWESWEGGGGVNAVSRALWTIGRTLTYALSELGAMEDSQQRIGLLGLTRVLTGGLWDAAKSTYMGGRVAGARPCISCIGLVPESSSSLLSPDQSHGVLSAAVQL